MLKEAARQSMNWKEGAASLNRIEILEVMDV